MCYRKDPIKTNAIGPPTFFLIALVGVGGECPQNVPPWCADYFELKSIKVQQSQEGYFPPFLKEIQTVKPA